MWKSGGPPNVWKLGAAEKYQANLDDKSHEKKAVPPSLFLAIGNPSTGKLTFPQEMMTLYSTDEARDEKWTSMLRDAMAKFPGTSLQADEVKVEPSAKTEDPLVDVWSLFEGAHKTMIDLKGDENLVVLKTIPARNVACSISIVIPKEHHKASVNDIDLTYVQLYLSAEQDGATMNTQEWLLTPGACDWLVDASAKKCLGMQRSKREKGVCQCEWQGHADKIALQVREGVDDAPATWLEVLAKGEKDGKTDYSITQHDFKLASGSMEQPVAARGDTCSIHSMYDLLYRCPSHLHMQLEPKIVGVFELRFYKYYIDQHINLQQ